MDCFHQRLLPGSRGSLDPFLASEHAALEMMAISAAALDGSIRFEVVERAGEGVK
jgi:hypothetical protein